jgi:hypothetical protein
MLTTDGKTKERNKLSFPDSLRRSLKTSAVGLIGDVRVMRALNALDGWRVWHNLNLGDEVVRHVLGSPKGFFMVEVKAFRSPVRATPKGLSLNGEAEPDQEIVHQLWQQAYRLKELIGGQHVQPVMVCISELEGEEAKGVPCLRLGNLVTYLRSQREVLRYEKARAVFAVLDALSK